MWPNSEHHPKFEMLKVVSDIRFICRGELFRPICRDAFLCLEEFKKAVAGQEPSDSEVQDTFDAMLKSLITEVQS